MEDNDDKAVHHWPLVRVIHTADHFIMTRNIQKTTKTAQQEAKAESHDGNEMLELFKYIPNIGSIFSFPSPMVVFWPKQRKE
jgi:hypothetical protein